MIFRKLLKYSFFLLLSLELFSQDINPSLLKNYWKAQWIAVPEQSSQEYGVYLFRKKINITSNSDDFLIHVSADNRYKLFVNENLVSTGPARGDLEHWNFETIDLKPFLREGENIIAAQVWNEGDFKPEAQISYKTGFLLQSDKTQNNQINTNNTWKCTPDSSFAPLIFKVPTYYVSGAGEIRNMANSKKDWMKLSYDDTLWSKAKFVQRAGPKNVDGPFGTTEGWMLVPSSIPAMEIKAERLAKLDKAQGIGKLPEGFPAEKVDLEIPAFSEVSLLLDQEYLTNAYANIVFSNGNKSTITLQYAESLYTKFPNKGNRNETEGKEFIGRKDSLMADGSLNQHFTSLTYRTYRYLLVKIKTQDEPLIINDIYGEFTGYPFQLNASFESSLKETQQILNIGWRTARLCATETYMDCPYYEQLQYIGDTRIQALVSLYNSGDDRLVKNALNQMDFSRRPEGITLSRHPSFTAQYIPTFSLWYIGMLHDYSLYGNDRAFVQNKIHGTREILNYFQQYQQADGSLRGVPQWLFTDWVENAQWRAGEGPKSKDGTSAMLDLQLLWAYQLGASLEKTYGMPAFSEIYLKKAEQLRQTIRDNYWEAEKQLMADVKEKNIYSQHTNALAILTGVLYRKEEEAVAKQMLTNKNLVEASIYFKYYIHMAMTKAGMGDDYLEWLDVWRENINLGLSTWAEKLEVNTSRSDCHAWGASPNIEFYRTILGIDSDAPQFQKVKINPHLGALKKVKGSMPHPKGKIEVEYQKIDDDWLFQVKLPAGVDGTFVWKNSTRLLHEGQNQLRIKPTDQ